MKKFNMPELEVVSFAALNAIAIDDSEEGGKFSSTPIESD